MSDKTRKAKDHPDVFRSNYQYEDDDAYAAHLARNDAYVGRLTYEGNTVAFIKDKVNAYRKCIDEAWRAMGEAGFGADGSTPLPEAIRRALSSEVAPGPLSGPNKPDGSRSRIPPIAPTVVEPVALETVAYLVEWPDTKYPLGEQTYSQAHASEVPAADLARRKGVERQELVRRVDAMRLIAPQAPAIPVGQELTNTVMDLIAEFGAARESEAHSMAIYDLLGARQSRMEASELLERIRAALSTSKEG